MIAHLGGCCVRCGTTENLHFDHIDPEQKSFDIKANMTLNNPKVKAELDKCQLLCGPHHREKTALEQSGWTHGTTYAWMKKGCRCEICRPIWRAWHDARNEKRRMKGGGKGPYRPRSSMPIRQSN